MRTLSRHLGQIYPNNEIPATLAVCMVRGGGHHPRHAVVRCSCLTACLDTQALQAFTEHASLTACLDTQALQAFTEHASLTACLDTQALQLSICLRHPRWWKRLCMTPLL